MQIQTPRTEIYRYLGYRGIEPDDVVSGKIEACILELEKVSQPRNISRRFPLVHEKDGTLRIEDMVIESQSLSKNLKGCDHVILFAATIGQGVDQLIRRAELRDMTAAAIYQAAGAAMVEEYCDMLNKELVERAKEDGFYCRPRFSPGYGDFALAHQTDFFRLLEITKNTAISLSDTLLMSPSKSVTALIGLSRHEEPCILQGCESCPSRSNCEFHR